MTHTLTTYLKLIGMLLTLMIAVTSVTIHTAQAAPPSGAPTFAKAAISVEPRGEEAGGLTCSWQETGLGSYQVVYYSCQASAVGVLEACVYKNKLVANTPTRLSIFKDVSGEHGQPIPFLSKNNGQINASTTTAIPESHGAGELCVEPTVAEVVAVRWCDASLTDVTNGLLGTNASELFQEFTSGAGTVPSCPELLAAPPTDGGGGG